MGNNLMNALAQSQYNQQQGQTQQGGMQQRSSLFNPFDSGMTGAINSARASLGLSDGQKDAALRKSLLTFGQGLAAQPRAKGFLANFGQVGKALAPSIMAYDDAEAAGEAENMAIAKEIADRDNYERQRLAQAEQQAWNNDFHNRQLAETTRGHNLMDNFRTKQLDAESGVMGDPDDPSNPTAGMNKYQKKVWERQASNNIKYAENTSDKFTKNNEILPQIDELSELLSTSNLAGSSKLAAFKRYVAQQTGADEDVLNSNNLGQFYLEWLSDNTSGVLSDKDIAIYSKGFATIDKNPKAAVDSLNRLKQRISSQQNKYQQQLDLFNQNPGANLHTLNIIQPQGAPNPQAQIPAPSAVQPDQFGVTFTRRGM